MRTSASAALTVAASLGLSACAGGTDVFGDPAEGYLRNPSVHLAAADWAGMSTVTVTLSEYAFEPSDLAFRTGGAYRLRIENVGSATHYFTSESFFKAIAARRLATPAGEPAEEVERPVLRSIAVAPGEVKELEFVPARRGAYRLECTAPFHAAFGMAGRIRIE